MREFVFATSLLALTACGQPPSQPEAGGVASPAQQIATPASTTPRSSVEGWQTDLTAFPLAGSTLPAFTAKQDDGTELTDANLRNRWTILGFAQPGDDKGEATYIAALNSAADQDPDLDFLGVEILRGAASPSHGPIAWPHVNDPGTLADALQITKTPVYLLIGPDLTIEGYREALTTTPDDGIKSVIRGVAQIRKQIAAPE